MVLVAKTGAGKFGLYVKPTSGDLTAPFTNPGANLDKVQFHTDLDVLQLHMGPTDVTITHAAVAGITRTTGSATFPEFNIKGQWVRSDNDLITHGLGYIPTFMVLLGTTVLTSGYDVQNVVDAEGMRVRMISPYATATKIRLASFGASSDVSLPSISKTYTVVVFKRPAAAGNVDFHFDTATGRVMMGRGKFDSNEKRLRSALPAESPYDIPLGTTIHIKNGRARRVLGDGLVQSESGYNGSFAGPTNFQGVIK